MSDDAKRDLSSMVDEIPSDVKTIEVTSTPVQSVEEGDELGETAEDVRKPDGSAVSFRTRIHDRISGYEQLRQAQCAKSPCAGCGNGQFLRPGSDHWNKVSAFLTDVVHRDLAKGGLGIWQDLGPSAFLYCEDDPIRPALDRNGEPVVKPDGTPQMMGGPGYKYLRYNCPAWRESNREFLPDWLPQRAARVVDKLVAVSKKMQQVGVGGFLRKLRGGKR